MKTKVTELEQDVLLRVVDNEYMGEIGEKMIDYPVWTQSVTNEDKSLAGALGSLVKKGYVFSTLWNKNETVCGLTKKGYDYLKENDLLD